MSFLIKNGRVIDPFNESDKVVDILIEGDKISGIGSGLTSGPDTEVIDAAGKIITPGLFDMHVHLREPGYEAQEDIETGTLAAAYGGFTGVACMGNTYPVVDNAAVVKAILSRSAQVGSCRVYPIGTITKGLEGKELAEIGDMAEAGIVAVSDDGRCVENSAVMRNALLYTKALGLPVISHSEDHSLSSGGLMHEGYYSTVLGLKGIPAAAEEIMVARDCLLAENTGARLHLAHVSTRGSVEIIREAKARGVQVTCEATPHHITLTHRDVYDYDTNYKVNPPLRSQEDVEAIIAGFQDGTIDAIASDHAPHTREAKEVEYAYAPWGISGIETMVALVSTNLIGPGYLDWMQAISKLTVGPAKILGLSQAGITAGALADLTIIDPQCQRTVDVSQFKSKGKNSPFNGRKLTGWPEATICGGKLSARYNGND